MTAPLPGQLLRVGEETVAYLTATLGITRRQAASLHTLARVRGELEFVAETRLFTADNPRGWRAGSARYLLARVPGRNLLRLTVLTRDSDPAPDESRRLAGISHPDDSPHCRAHPQFRSDCARCVAERETAGAA